MVTDKQVREIALFFLLTLMDERVSVQAAQKTVSQLKATSLSAETSDKDLIRILRKIHDQHRKLLPRNRPSTTPQQVWNIPQTVAIGPWIKFQKDASEPEVMALVLGKVLRYDEAAIAAGLNISLGTAQYRIGKGVRHLGLIAKNAKGSSDVER